MDGTPLEFSIRVARPEDAASIAGVHVTSWRQAYSGVIPDTYLSGIDVAERAVRWSRELASPTHRTWVATTGASAVVGFASLGESRDEDAGRLTLELLTLYLHPQVWGRGVARALMRTVIDHVPAANDVTLWVLADNDRARQFYRRHGFSEDGVERMATFDNTDVLELRYRRK
ncbi:GNAT family N-acetyltransferase [Rarobacter incanus]|uniref:L-amino acid N-acyltransferase YncA n=1 Tax=Rarobacter incanus TaxID=153494 RepID=A0A542SRQ1_9MICO|nr:GNAT family N-acetyltransferase [Rarobacter incanus]TQK77258.1 L-amino acid N-acyltransferase YncA [Rarobacter incanus]